MKGVFFIGLFKNLVFFGAGVFVANYTMHKLAGLLRQMKDDTNEIIQNEALIKQMCVDQITKWYYNGELNTVLRQTLKEREILDEETKLKLNQLRNSVPNWPK